MDDGPAAATLLLGEGCCSKACEESSALLIGWDSGADASQRFVTIPLATAVSPERAIEALKLISVRARSDCALRELVDYCAGLPLIVGRFGLSGGGVRVARHNLTHWSAALPDGKALRVVLCPSVSHKSQDYYALRGSPPEVLSAGLWPRLPRCALGTACSALDLALRRSSCGPQLSALLAWAIAVSPEAAKPVDMATTVSPAPCATAVRRLMACGGSEGAALKLVSPTAPQSRLWAVATRTSMVCAHAERRLGLVIALIHSTMCRRKRAASADVLLPTEVEMIETQWRRRATLALCGDLALGCVLGLALARWRVELGDAAYDSLGRSLQSDVMRRRILWVMEGTHHAPMGFKLNAQLDSVLGSMVLLVVDIWHFLTAMVAPMAPSLLCVAAALAPCGGGLSMLLALSFDAVAVLTLHVRLLYRNFARIHDAQLRLMAMLVRLLRGRKRNVLRDRVDSYGIAEHDDNQTMPLSEAPPLLLGTLGFAIVFFLFQTTALYYGLFAVLWLMVLAVESAIWFLLEIVSESPLHAALLVLRCKEGSPSPLPAGIRVRRTSTGALHLCPGAATLSHVAEGCMRPIAARWARHYGDSGLLMLLRGAVIPLPPSALARE